MPLTDTFTSRTTVEKAEIVQKFNQNHDSEGRFSVSGGGGAEETCSTCGEAASKHTYNRASGLHEVEGKEPHQLVGKKPEAPAEPAKQAEPEKPKGPRSLAHIARDIRKDWGGKVNYAAKPYLEAMSGLDTMDGAYGQDSARSIVAYFLSNASSWRGPKAKEIKNELKAMLAAKPVRKIEGLDRPRF